MYYAAECGPLTHKNLCDLTGLHPVSLWRILPKLVSEKKLYCVSQGMHKPNVYATYNIAKRTDFPHDLARADVATAIHRTGLVTYWTQPRQKLSVYKSVNEDARFELTKEFEDRIGTLHFFLEMDTGTEGYWQLEDKFKRYLAQGENAQVLFVVKHNPLKSHRTKPTTLASLAEKYINKSQKHTWNDFLFADYAEFLADPLGPVCHVPYDPARYSILESLLN
jgi:protein involved in plasmid replication-relaxation